MNSFNFKNALKNFKESKQKETKEELILYKDVIKEKLKENKKEDSILKKFDDVEEVRNEWTKKRNDLLNAQKDKKMKVMNINEIEPSNNNINTDKNNDLLSLSSDNIDEANVPKEFEITVNKKEWKITVDPKQYTYTLTYRLIEEIQEQSETKRSVNVEKLTTEYKCTELYNWFHMMFQEWENELDVRIV
jgi:hypothetical protein